MQKPTVERLTADLLRFMTESQIRPAHSYADQGEKSGVYAVLNCVLSARAPFKTVVLPALQKFEKNSGLPNTADLKFSQFLDHVRGEGNREPAEERFLEIASKEFSYRGRLSGRTKVEVAYDVCRFFLSHGLETIHELKSLPTGVPYTCEHAGTPGKLEELVMAGLVDNRPDGAKVRGIGIALGAYLMILLGDESYVKPDTLLLRLMGRIGDWEFRASNSHDFQLVRQAISCAAAQVNSTPAALDNALWRYESERIAH